MHYVEPGTFHFNRLEYLRNSLLLLSSRLHNGSSFKSNKYGSKRCVTDNKVIDQCSQETSLSLFMADKVYQITPLSPFHCCWLSGFNPRLATKPGISQKCGNCPSVCFCLSLSLFLYFSIPLSLTLFPSPSFPLSLSLSLSPSLSLSLSLSLSF